MGNGRLQRPALALLLSLALTHSFRIPSILNRSSGPSSSSRRFFHATSLPTLTSAYVDSVLLGSTPSDVVVDATCGNGHDSLFLAERTRRLFPAFGTQEARGGSTPTLLAIDVNPLAVERTEERLRGGGFVRSESVLIECRSHAPLFPRGVPPSSSLLLAMYNLGYLPNNPAGKDPSNPASPHTSSSSTLSSLSSASSLLRVGGALIVTSYPGSNEPEHVKVLSYFTALATRGFVGGKKGGSDCPNFNVQEGTNYSLLLDDEVKGALSKVDEDDARKIKTFRSFSTRPLGRNDSPVLTVCERIR